LQTLVGVATLAVAAVLASGAIGISSDAGYSGVGPNFMPWLVSAALAVCGVWLVWEARTGGFRELEPGSGADRGHWSGFVWVSAGLLLNAALITTIGFILSCTLCFVLAVRGFKSGEGRLDLSLRSLATDALIGAVIAAPVYWMFTQLLAVNLPGLTQTGWF
jgi:putative tricarboxylic transport membrane protein